MLKPLIIVSQKMAATRNRPSYISDHFMDDEFYPTFCGYDVRSISKEQDKVDYILAVLPDTVADDVRQTLYYLRDMCIDEEKSVFLCGTKESLHHARQIIPSMILQGAYEIEKGEIDYVANQMHKKLTAEGEKKGCLIVDDDMEYNKKLRLALLPYCDVAFSDGTPAQTMPYIGQTRLLMISMDMKLDMLAWARLRAMIAKNKKRSDFHTILIAKDDARQKEVTRYLGEQGGICLSKEVDFLENANYLRQTYFS